MYIFTNMYIYIHVYICTHAYIYMYICVHIYICIFERSIIRQIKLGRILEINRETCRGIAGLKPTADTLAIVPGLQKQHACAT